MLVLARKLNESLVIDERIIVTVVEVRGNQIRLGIEAPKEVSICREELVGQGSQSLPTRAVTAETRPAARRRRAG
jgi:carbon storage regulator